MSFPSSVAEARTGSGFVGMGFDPSSWNWNKFGSGSRNLGDLLYLMNGESAPP